MQELTVSQRFVEKISYEWQAEFNNKLQFSEYHKTLAQHLLIKINFSLKELNEKWQQKGENKRINWDNIDEKKLYTDSVHIINLGLDGLIKNHISVLPYWNKSKNKFDIDLYIGYMGKDWVKRQMAIIPPKDIRYELVYTTDEFKPIKKGNGNDVESYTFDIKNPFTRGEIIGGFGYLQFEDPTLNKLVLVTKEQFEKSKKSSKSGFWTYNYEEMAYKTIIHRTCDKIQLDPRKVSTSYFMVAEEPEDQVEKVEEDVIEFSKVIESEGPGF